MELDRLHIIYYSPTHTSKKIARSIGEGTGIARRQETDLTTDSGKAEITVMDAICVVAVPVYGGLVAPTAAERILRLKAVNCVAVPVVVYGNRDYEDALVQLRDLLRGQGFTPLCGAAFIGEHSYSRPGMPVAEGRPDSNDLRIAREFGQALFRKLTDELGISDAPAPDSRHFALTYDTPLDTLIATADMKGNVPYKTIGKPTPQAPVVNENCYGCGDCAGWCPTGAISIKDGRSDTQIDLCTKCCACVKFCPTGARTFDTPYTAMLHEKCSVRREPEIFV